MNGVYIENPKESIKHLLELVSKLAYVKMQRQYTQKTIVFLYSTRGKLDSKIRKTISFTVLSKT